MFKQLSRIFLLVLTSIVIVGCASLPAGEIRSKSDPFEPMNRAVFSFNEVLDDYLMTPVAKAYRFVVPEFLRERFSNMFSNIGDIYTSVNNLLQGKPKEAADDLVRVFVNTTLGLGGMFDVATAGGMEKRKEDFGQTLGVWGVGPGPYIVLPLFGASNLRDTAGFFVDIKTDILFQQIPDTSVRNTVTGVRIVDMRAKYLDSSNLLQEAAIDKYTFVRDAYFQRRRNLIYDGNPPEIKEEEDDQEPSSQAKVESKANLNTESPSK
jgi:phospholipid-binding lipoprotein MlaA